MWQLREDARIALRAIVSNKLRSFLTLLGIIFGIFSVVVMVGIGAGLQGHVAKQFQELGANLLFVYEGGESTGQTLELKRTPRHIDEEDVQAILREATEVRRIAPEVDFPATLKKESYGMNVEVRGVTPEFEFVRSFPVQRGMGRFLTDSDVAGKARVAVIGRKVYEKLFRGRNPVGEDLKINGVSFKVIGVLAEKGDQDAFSAADNVVLIPVTTAQQRFLEIHFYHFLNVEARSFEGMNRAEEQIRYILRRQHVLSGAEKDDFSIFSMNEIISRVNAILVSFNAVFGILAFISLLTGGIGIMNIMLVTVTERTREIGVRKAVGAKRRNILLQFLVEAVVLCLFGAGIGILLAWGGIRGISNLEAFTKAMGTPTFSIQAVVLAVVVATMVGVFFGLWPAMRAARLDPIQALRYE